jgi:predicted DNA-binding ribbon-helix-helix protein
MAREKKIVLKSMAKEKKKFTLVNFTIPEDDLARLRLDAKKYCLGNLSGWIRYCCLNYRPTEKELVEVSD